MKKVILTILAAMAIGVMGCKKDDDKTTSFPLTIYAYYREATAKAVFGSNETTLKAPNITVTLYKSSDDLRQQKNQVASGVTNAEGVVNFDNLEGGVYYVEASNDRCFSNISDIEQYKNEIRNSQILMFPGGFSAGDEPDGSAKFFATVFRNEILKKEIEDLLGRDGLILGICNGFQTLIKLGLLPDGKIKEQEELSATLATNTIGRHISKMAYLKLVSNKSPWLMNAKLGDVYANPVSHGEGRFVATKEKIDELFKNGQVATRYVDLNGNPTMCGEYNPNGSYAAIEGITSPDGRIFGKMAHSERRENGVAINVFEKQDLQIFESGVKYFR